MPILQINSLNDFELALKRKEYQATLVYYTAVWCLPSEGIRYFKKSIFIEYSVVIQYQYLLEASTDSV